MRSVGTYEVLRTLARGGMAELLLARADRAHGFQKLVVLKRIHPHLADDPGFVEMFLDEARLAAQLDHPNVVQVFELGEDNGSAFFAMEYLRGLDVRRLLIHHGGALPLREALTIASGAAAGLHHAHTKLGIDGTPLAVIHRDVSPNNVIVTLEGAVKLLDFGIAKASTNQRHTAQSRLKGKVAYMSPEQCSGTSLDARSDVFALGSVLYEMTTGRRPFEGDAEFKLMNAIINHPVVAPSRHVADYPPELEAIVLRAMERDPDRRFGSAAEMRRALDSFARDHGGLSSAAELGDFVDRYAPRDDDDPAIGNAAPMGVASATAPTVAQPEPTETLVRGRFATIGWVAAGMLVAGVTVFVGMRRDDDSDPPYVSAPAAPTTARAASESEPELAGDRPAQPAVALPPAPAPTEAKPEAHRDQDTAAPPVATPTRAGKKRPTKQRRKAKPKPADAEVAPAPVDGNAWVPIRRDSP